MDVSKRVRAARHKKWWLEQGESEQMQILSNLVGKTIAAMGNPERPLHADFLAAMVAQYVSCGKL